jgi:hypothetical protein
LNVDLLNYKNMENQYVTLSPQDSMRLRPPERTSLNEGRNQILITKPIQDLLAMIEERFVSGTSQKWSCRLVKGMQGTGKSFAFALAAAFLQNHGIKVYRFRSVEQLLPEIESLLVFRSPHSDPLAVIFVDEIERHEHFASKLRMGSNLQRRCVVVGCGSGNIRFPLPSSETILVGRDYTFGLTIPFSSFQTFFASLFGQTAQQIVQVRLLRTVSEMLDFHPTCISDFYKGTQAHFASIRVIQFALERHGGNVSEAWESAKDYFIHSMREFLFKSEVPSLAGALHQLIFQNFDPDYGRFAWNWCSSVDHRYIWEDRICSPLFAQAYQRILVEHPISLLQISSLSKVD